VGIFLYLVEMRRWFTLAGLALMLVGIFGHVRPVVWIGLALIGLQVVVTIWAGVNQAKAARRAKEPEAQ
jgi:hypothetical protein